mmetsp:Transcript_4167/g.13118  ORF Transcript_4167/g.13118 Transcript_4167/m.13118 type:complete len:107 (-) Transcript_4167:646-966(-)
MCTVMPLSLHHVADEVVTLDVDFNLELTFGDVIHSRVFQLKSQRRFLPDLGASFGIKFLRLADCRTRLWWSFSESKLMVAFRAPPDVKWDIAARVFGLELPNWLEV